MRVENTTVIGRKLREWRARNNMTQKKTAQKLLCHVSSLTNWERGKTVPDYYFIKAIHDMTGYKYNVLAPKGRFGKISQDQGVIYQGV